MASSRLAYGMYSRFCRAKTFGLNDSGQIECDDPSGGFKVDATYASYAARMNESISTGYRFEIANLPILSLSEAANPSAARRDRMAASRLSQILTRFRCRILCSTLVWCARRSFLPNEWNLLRICRDTSRFSSSGI